jgi:chromosome partitioning protein
MGLDKNSLKKSIYDCLIEDEDANDVILSSSFENVWVLPANADLAGAEIELANIEEREFRLKKVIENLKANYDFMLIDCPPSLGLLTINALTLAQTVLIPIQCEYYALEGVGQLINTITLVKRGLNKALEVEGVILTMFDSRTNLSNQVVDEVVSYFKEKVYQTTIPRNVRLAEAPSYGQSIFEYAENSKGAKAYLDLAEEFLNRQE